MSDDESGSDSMEGKLKNMFAEFNKKLLDEIDCKLDSKLEKFKKDVKNEILNEVNELKKANINLQKRIVDLETKISTIDNFESQLQEMQDLSDKMEGFKKMKSDW